MSRKTFKALVIATITAVLTACSQGDVSLESDKSAYVNPVPKEIGAATTLATEALVNAVAYHWKSHSVLDEVAVVLVDAGGNRSSDKGFTSRILPVGTYQVSVSPTASTGTRETSVDLKDALAALKLAIGIESINGTDSAGKAIEVSAYQRAAADFNADGLVNLKDALEILKYSIGVPVSSTARWQYFHDTEVIAAGSPPKVELSGATRAVAVNATTSVGVAAVLTGDVDGSWRPSQTSAQVDPSYYSSLVSRLQTTDNAVTLARWGIADVSGGDGSAGGGGSTFPGAPKPTVSVALSKTKAMVGTAVSLGWTSTNASSCKGSDSMPAGALAKDGIISITPTAGGIFKYSISCDGNGGTTIGSVVLVVPIPVQKTSYLNAKNLNIPSQRYPAFNQLEHNGSYSDNLGAGVAFADFFQEGKISMIWFTNRGYFNQPLVPNQGVIKFYRFDDNGNPIEQTSELLGDVNGCISPRKLLVADFNGDGKPDIFASCHGAELTPGTLWPGEYPRVLLSQPNGRYVNTLTALNCYCHTAAAADLNGDGFVDILTSDQRLGMPGSPVDSEATAMILLSNDGKGNFAVQRNYAGINTSMPSVASYNPLTFALGGGKTNTFTMELVDVNGDEKPDLIFGTSDDLMFPSRVYLNRNNRFDTVDALIPIGVQGFWAIDIVVEDSFIYFYGLKNYYDTINVYKYDFNKKAGSIIYDSNGKRWPNANIDIDWVWMIPYNGNLVPLSDAYTGVTVPM